MVKKQNQLIILIIIFFNQLSFSQVKYLGKIAVEIELSPEIPSYRDIDSDFIIEQDSAYLEPLISGKKKSLYYYKPKGSKGNFYIRTDKGIELLKHKKYILIGKDGYMLKQKNYYIAQLNEYFKECPEIIKNTQKLKYKKEDLISIFADYYTCINTDVPITKEIKEAKFEFGLLLGLSSTKLNFQGIPSDFPIVQADFKASYNPTGGFYVDVLFSGKNQRWSSYNEFLFTVYNAKGKYLFINSSNDFLERIINVNRSYVTSKSLIRYKHPVGSAFVFINGGIYLGVVVNSKDSEKYLKPYDNVLSKKIERGLVIGIGTKFKRVSFSLAAEFGNGLSKNEDISSKSRRFSILTGYNF